MELFEKLGIDWRLIAIQIVNFGIVLFILKKFLYKPIVEMLEKRRRNVDASLETIEKVKREHEDFERYKGEEMRKVQGESQMILARASEHAAMLEAKAQEEVSVKTQETLARARKVIEEEKEKIVEEAKKEITELVVEATGKLLSEKVKQGEGERLAQRSFAQHKKA